MKPYEIIAIIEKTAPLEAAAEWDNSGVQIASRKDNISRVAAMLDPRAETIAEALADGADFILSHHPMTRSPRFLNKVDEYTDIASMIYKNDAWLYSAHTSLDANPAGPVRWLGDELGLKNMRLLEETASPLCSGVPSCGYGFGFVGDLPEALSYEAFVGVLKKALPVPSWNVCGLTPGTVRRVACCPGSGSDFVLEAREAGADVFITGDVKYHTALDASAMLPRMIDVGHFSLEEEMTRRFAAQLEKELSIPVVFYPGKDPLVRE